jgi:glutathione S-transferase
MLTLYYAAGTCALASHIALEESGAEFEARRLDFKAGEQRSDAYLKINPKGRVPALLTPRGVLTETPAILGFIAQSFPEKALAPFDEAFAFAELQAFVAYLCSTVHVCHAHRVRGARWADEEASFADMRRKVPETMAACFELIETHLFKGPWAMGERYTIADPYLFTIAGWLEGDSVDIARFPRIHDHFGRMRDRASVRRALQTEAA